MSSLKLRIKGWEDGQPVERELERPDRWALHAADQVTLELDGTWAVTINQRPAAVTAKKMGVGACAWEGEMLLAAYLLTTPTHRYTGLTVVELGAGPGLAGLLAAKLGARAVITDKAVVLPLIQENIALNGLRGQPTASCSGSAEAEELEWGSPGAEAQVRHLAALRPDLVIAADCCYIDQDGESPSTPHFIAACRDLCNGTATRVLVSFELRSSAVKATFLAEAAKAFSQVNRVPLKSLPKCYRVEHIELYELRL